MSKKGTMRYLLDEEVFTVFNKEVASINANNNGLLNESVLDKRKRLLLKTAVEYLTDEVVKVKRGYPVKDIQDVGLEVDCVIMNRETFNIIKNYIYEK